jgi:hypothetical protein
MLGQGCLATDLRSDCRLAAVKVGSRDHPGLVPRPDMPRRFRHGPRRQRSATGLRPLRSRIRLTKRVNR